MPFRLRAYEPADFETLYILDRDCYPRGIAYSRGTLRWFLAQPGAECFVAISGESDAQDFTSTASSIAGFIVAAVEGSEGHIITLDVAIPYRRLGVGTALLGKMERRLADRGVHRVSLETKTSNEAAVAFWNRHGYRTVSVLRRYYLDRFDAYFMQKWLGPASEGRP